jgi:5-(carboxyamino)imidazole ribonucleotide mutase
MPKVAILMGSTSDSQIMAPAEKLLKSFGIKFEKKTLSAHRNPEEVANFSKRAKGNGLEVIIAGAGKAAHLPGVIASYTTLPVIGVPVSTLPLSGLDALFSMVQMPSGVPVATVGIDDSKNAALLAAQILALKDKNISAAIEAYKHDLSKPKKPKLKQETERPFIDG